jgi:hypothetical protein
MAIFTIPLLDERTPLDFFSLTAFFEWKQHENSTDALIKRKKNTMWK